MRQNAAMGWMMLTMVEGISRSEGGVGAMLLNQNKHFHLSAVFAIQLTIPAARAGAGLRHRPAARGFLSVRGSDFGTQVKVRVKKRQKRHHGFLHLRKNAAEGGRRFPRIRRPSHPQTRHRGNQRHHLYRSRAGPGRRISRPQRHRQDATVPHHRRTQQADLGPRHHQRPRPPGAARRSGSGRPGLSFVRASHRDVEPAARGKPERKRRQGRARQSRPVLD